MNFNGLTPAESERLAWLAEECGEIVQIIGKILRHGYESCHPDDPSKTTNRGLLEYEIGDAQIVLSLMFQEEDLELANIRRHASKKPSGRYLRYLHHNKFKEKA